MLLGYGVLSTTYCALSEALLPRQSDEGGDCVGDHTDDRGGDHGDQGQGDHGDRSEGDHHGGSPVVLLVPSAKWPSPATPEPRVIPPRECYTSSGAKDDSTKALA